MTRDAQNGGNLGFEKCRGERKYGVPPAGNANYAWIQHFIHHLAPNGIAGFVMSNGSLSTSTKAEFAFEESQGAWR